MAFKGIFPILATPFRPDGEMDEVSLERLIDFLVGAGVQGITLFGLGGEFYKLTDDERRTMQSMFLARTAGRLLRIISIPEHSTEVARQRALEAAESGADGLMILPPFFLAPGPAAVADHIGEIARSVRTPLLIQYAPHQTGLHLSAEFFVALAEEFPHLRMVKVDSTPAGPMISSLVEESRGQIQPFVGYAGLQMVDAFARGAVGCMPGCSLPEPYLEIYRALETGERKQAAVLHARLLPLLNFMMQSLEFIIQCEKAILYWRGLIASDYCRRPGVKLSRHDRQTLRALLEVCVPLLKDQCNRSSWM